MPRRSWLLWLGAVLVLLAGCDSVPERSDDPWEQSWILSHIQTPEGSIAGATTPQGAHIVFRPALQGSDGCDLFSGRHEFTDPQLEFFDIEYQYTETHPVPAACPEEAVFVRDALRSALADGVVISALTADLMVWESEETGLTFEFYPGVEG